MPEDTTHYRVHLAKGNLTVRQREANRLGCICYVEQHLNASLNPNINHGFVIVAGESVSQETIDWGRAYMRRIAETFNHPNRGVVFGPCRGSYNVKLVKCPAFLAEPGFISNEEFAAAARTGEGIDALAICLVQSIIECFPQGGLVGLSAGHCDRGKPDPGAPVNEPGEPDSMLDPAFDDEAELNAEIVRSAKEMLEAYEPAERRTAGRGAG